MADFTKCRAFAPSAMLSRLLTIIAGSLAYCSWCGWLNMLSESGWIDEFWGQVVFTLLIFGLMFLLAMWHMRRSEKLRNATEELLQPEASPVPEFDDSSDEHPGVRAASAKAIVAMQTTIANHTDLVGAAALLEGYGNLTDAMGYMLAQIWIDYLQSFSRPLLEALVITAISTSVLLLLELFEKRLPMESGMRAVLHTFGQVGVGSCAWFVSTPAEQFYHEMFGTSSHQTTVVASPNTTNMTITNITNGTFDIDKEEVELPPLWSWWVSIMGSVFFVTVSSWLLSTGSYCHGPTIYTEMVSRKRLASNDPAEEGSTSGAVSPEGASEDVNNLQGAGSMRSCVSEPMKQGTSSSVVEMQEEEPGESRDSPNLPTRKDVMAFEQLLMMDGIWCEKAVAMIEAASFFTSARLLRARILHRTAGACESVLFWDMSIFYALACVVSILLEQMLEWLPKSDDVLLQKFSSDAVTLVVRTIGWIAAKLTVDFWTAVLDAHDTAHPRLFWCCYAIICQVSSILVEYRASWKHYVIILQRYSVKKIQEWHQKAVVMESSEEDSDCGSEQPDDDE